MMPTRAELGYQIAALIEENQRLQRELRSLREATREPCMDCDGTGDTYAWHGCPSCNGTGYCGPVLDADGLQHLWRERIADRQALYQFQYETA